MKALKIFSWVLLLNMFVFTSCAQDQNSSPTSSNDDNSTVTNTTTTTHISQSNTSNQTETMVLIKTTMGDMKIVLYNETPYHRDNFIKLVNDGFYEGLLFHRVIDEFMIQGGDPGSKNASSTTQLGSGGPGYTLPAEINPDLFHKKGALSAARTGDQGNPTRRSSGSQFYVVTGKVYTEAELDMLEQRMSTKFSDAQREAYTTIGGTPFLDAQYTVFGEIVEGVDVAVNISKVSKNASDRPNDDIKIISMEVID